MSNSTGGLKILVNSLHAFIIETRFVILMNKHFYSNRLLLQLKCSYKKKDEVGFLEQMERDCNVSTLWPRNF